MSSRISIALATYNGAKFLPAQLDSLAKQSLRPHELRIGDDGSTDDTEAVVRTFARNAPFPVHFQRNATALGYGENFLQTAKRCTGDWIAFCDQDDFWLPGKLEFCAARIAGHDGGMRLLCHNAWISDENLNPIRLLYDYRGDELHSSFDLEPEWFSVGFAQLLARELLDKVPIRPRPSVPWHPHSEAHDVWASLVANATGSVLLCAEPLVLYRRHQDNVSKFNAIPNRLARLRGKLMGNPTYYRQHAEYARILHETLSIYSVQTEDREFRNSFASAARKVSAYSALCSMRVALYDEPNISKRLGLLRRMIARGAYSGNGGSKMKGAALLKDGFNLLLPRTRVS